MAATPILQQGPGGRSGSTLLMEVLARSPEVGCRRVRPYEDRPFSHLLEHLDALAQSVPAERTRRDRAFDRLARSVERLADDAGVDLRRTRGLPPAAVPKSLRALERAGRGDAATGVMLSVAWSALAEVLATLDDYRPPGAPAAAPRFHAEKARRRVLRRTRAVGFDDLRVIYRLRDPRDIWLSVLAFDRARGWHGFGRRRRQSEESFLDDFLETQRTYLSDLASRELSAGEIVVRYDELVTDPVGQADRLARWLDIDPGALDGLGRSPDAGHVTAGSPEASVGRWRRELSPERNERFVDTLGPLLEHHGFTS